MLEQVPTQMAEGVVRWAKLIIPLVVHSASKVRLRAAAAMEMGMPLLLQKQTEVAAIIEPMMASVSVAVFALRSRETNWRKVKYLMFNLFVCMNEHAFAVTLAALPAIKLPMCFCLSVSSETNPWASETFYVQEWNKCPEALAAICETAWEGELEFSTQINNWRIKDGELIKMDIRTIFRHPGLKWDVQFVKSVSLSAAAQRRTLHQLSASPGGTRFPQLLSSHQKDCFHRLEEPHR